MAIFYSRTIKMKLLLVRILRLMVKKILVMLVNRKLIKLNNILKLKKKKKNKSKMIYLLLLLKAFLSKGPENRDPGKNLKIILKRVKKRIIPILTI